VKNKFEDVYKRIGQEAKVPGFRVGNAPRDLIEKNFSSQAHEQVLKELVPEVYNQALEQEKLDVVELPEITEVRLERTALSFKAKVEIFPEIKLKKYKGMRVSYAPIAVSADELKRSIDSLKESRKLEAVDEGVAKGLGYPSVTELEKTLEHQLFIQKEQAQRQKIEHELIDALLKDVEVKLPQSLVDRQLQESLRRTKMDLAMRGVPREKLQEEEKNLVKELEPQARRQVEVYLVLAEIAKREGIANDDAMPQKVIEFLLKNADWKAA
jgi:FKBP-type peptidyl-prolyl cis-trans isomerase (trigger factor)